MAPKEPAVKSADAPDGQTIFMSDRSHEQQETSTAQLGKKEGGSASEKRATLKDLFRFADKKDWVLMVIGSIAAIVMGALFPLFAVLFGDTMNAFFPYDQAKIDQASLDFVFLAIGMGVASFVQYSCWAVAAARQVQRLRGECLKATLRQEIAWYDLSEAGTVSSRIAGDTVIIQEGLGQKFGDLLKMLAQIIAGYVIGFTRGWKLTLASLQSLASHLVVFLLLVLLV